MNNIIQTFKLRSGYKELDKKLMKDSINDHIELIFSMSNSVGSRSNTNLAKFSTIAYNEMLDKICYEEISTFEVYEGLYDTFKALKLELYKKIIDSLAKNYQSDNLLMLRTIDLTIDNVIRNEVFKELNVNSELAIKNPWEISQKILNNLNVLYYFSDDLTYYEENLRKVKNKKESEVSSKLRIGVYAKGNNKNFSNDSIRDTFALKNLLIDQLESQNRNCSNPIKSKDIVSFFRDDLAINELELTDSNIRNWIIKPLKNNVSLGSNKNGYFVIIDENDLNESYKSHYNNYIGYINTLERHKSLAKLNSWDSEGLSMHNSSE